MVGSAVSHIAKLKFQEQSLIFDDVSKTKNFVINHLSVGTGPTLRPLVCVK